MPQPPIRRAFVDVPFGQVHYRQAGDGVPVLLLHPSPGSGKQLTPLIEALALNFRVIAPDTPGFGDSSPLAHFAPAITDYARELPALLDALGLARVDVYGSHTGACIAAELAILAPERVGKLILDGVGVFDPAERDELLAHYAHPFVPDHDGSYLIKAFAFLRDQYLFYPWYARTRAARRDAGLRPAAELHDWLVELLKGAGTYHLGYRAAFAWDATGRLPLVRARTLLTASATDPLFAVTERIAGVLPEARFAALPAGDDRGFAAARAALFTEFLTAA